MVIKKGDNMLYSKKETAFFVGDELDVNIPSDAINVSEELEQEIRDAVMNGLSFEIENQKLLIK